MQISEISCSNIASFGSVDLHNDWTKPGETKGKRTWHNKRHKECRRFSISCLIHFMTASNTWKNARKHEFEIFCDCVNVINSHDILNVNTLYRLSQQFLNNVGLEIHFVLYYSAKRSTLETTLYVGKACPPTSMSWSPSQRNHRFVLSKEFLISFWS